MGLLEELGLTEEEFEQRLDEYITENSVEEALKMSGLIDEEGNINVKDDTNGNQE